MDQELNNPYLAPGAPLDQHSSAGETYEPRLFALSGRIGRLRYMAYLLALCGILMVASFVIVFALGISSLATGASGRGAAVWLPLLMALPFGALYVVLAVRRLNDTGYTGWLALLIFVPFVNFFAGLYLMCAPGSKGSNKYGLPPGPDSLAIKIAGWTMPALIVLSVAVSFVTPIWMATRGAGGSPGF